MSKAVAVVFLAAAVGLAWFAYSKVTEARRESAYREALAAYQRDLRLGTYRAEGQKYLDSRQIDYRAVSYGGSDTYEIKIGEEPGSLVCEAWTVYVALEFDPAEKLREVHVRKSGTCL
jgi:hypothetical protein